MADLLNRYLNEPRSRDDIWDELRELNNKQLLDDVSSHMSLLARQNVVAVVEALREVGYEFLTNDGADIPAVPFLSASPDAGSLVGWIGGTFGPLAPTVEAWMRNVGDVWFVGRFPGEEDLTEADPLVVEFERLRYPGDDVRQMYVDEHDAWEHNVRYDPDFGPFRLPFAPDRLHKANISGGMPASLSLSATDGSATADGWVVLDSPPQEMWFVDYLNAVFVGHGFLRPEYIPDRFREQLSELLAGRLHYL